MSPCQSFADRILAPARHRRPAFRRFEILHLEKDGEGLFTVVNNYLITHMSLLISVVDLTLSNTIPLSLCLTY